MVFIIVNTLLYCLIAYSFKIIYEASNFFHIAHCAFIVLSSYITWFLFVQLNCPLFVSILLSVIIGVGLVFLIYKSIYKPLLEKSVKSWKILIVSIGVYVVILNLISLIWGDSILSFRTWGIKEGNKLFGIHISDVHIITIISSVSLLILSWLFMEKTNVGLKIKAVSSNPELSSILGISKNNAIVWSFIIGTGLAACAGILIAADTDITPTIGFNWLLYGIVAMIIGGIGKIRYLLFGSLLLATIQFLAAYFLDSKWMNATAYIILIVFLYFKPYGFSGHSLKKAEI